MVGKFESLIKHQTFQFPNLPICPIIEIKNLYLNLNMFTLNLSKTLFWDIDLNNFDNLRNKRLIIERVFTRGDLDDIKATIKFYGIETIKNEIIYAGFLDNKTLTWTSDFFKIPKSDFRCFIKKQSKPTHWNY